MGETLEGMVFRRAGVGEIRGLRGAVLRPGTRVLVFAKDEAPATWHFGAFLGEGEGRERCVGAVTFLVSEWEGRAAYQLRGMAVEEGFRGRGVGGRLIDFAEPVVTGGGVGVLWCNAREVAIGFYEGHGWECVSGFFEVAGVGPHRRMVKVVAA